MKPADPQPRGRSSAPALALAEVPLAALAGGMLGAFAGPPGIVAGAILGSGAGATLAIAHNRQQHRDAELVDSYDETIGVIDGEMGAPNLSHPPARIGTYSRASLGLAREPDEPLAAGPISEGDA